MALVLLTLLILVSIAAVVADIARCDSWRVRFVPKFLWIVLVVALPLLGSALWIVYGKQPPARRQRG